MSDKQKGLNETHVKKRNLVNDTKMCHEGESQSVLYSLVVLEDETGWKKNKMKVDFIAR